MDFNDLAELIFPDAKDVSYYEEKYPERNLKEGAMVTRFAPSPTGFIHIGGLFGSIIDRKLAEQSEGVFILRIEDTDQKREIENGVEQIVNGLKDFGITPDEGVISETEEIGNYGPYKQSERKEIYEAYAKSLVKQGLAYPCFCTPEELDEIRAKQEAAKIKPGYYGVWAKYRTLPVEQAVEKIKNGEKYIIRFKSMGREDTAQVASGEKDGTGTGSTGDTGLLPIMQRGSGSHNICRLATISHATIQAIGMTGPGTQDAVGHDFPEPCGILGSQIAGNGCYAVGNRKRG